MLALRIGEMPMSDQRVVEHRRRRRESRDPDGRHPGEELSSNRNRKIPAALLVRLFRLTSFAIRRRDLCTLLHTLGLQIGPPARQELLEPRKVFLFR
jgi:hypothetical protein